MLTHLRPGPKFMRAGGGGGGEGGGEFIVQLCKTIKIIAQGPFSSSCSCFCGSPTNK